MGLGTLGVVGDLMVQVPYFFICGDSAAVEIQHHFPKPQQLDRVLTLLSNSELRSYLKVLSRCTQYVVFCESASVLRFARSINVDQIPALKSLAARGRMMIHNYRTIFDEYGFDTISYEALLTPVEWHGSQHYLILGIAKNRVPI